MAIQGPAGVVLITGSGKKKEQREEKKKTGEKQWPQVLAGKWKQGIGTLKGMMASDHGKMDRKHPGHEACSPALAR